MASPFKHCVGDVVEITSSPYKGYKGEVIAQYFSKTDLSPSYTIQCGKWLTVQVEQRGLKKLKRRG